MTERQEYIDALTDGMDLSLLSLKERDLLLETISQNILGSGHQLFAGVFDDLLILEDMSTGYEVLRLEIDEDTLLFRRFNKDEFSRMQCGVACKVSVQTVSAFIESIQEMKDLPDEEDYIEVSSAEDDFEWV